jgi:hypothetical protein
MISVRVAREIVLVMVIFRLAGGLARLVSALGLRRF